MHASVGHMVLGWASQGYITKDNSRGQHYEARRRLYAPCQTKAIIGTYFFQASYFFSAMYDSKSLFLLVNIDMVRWENFILLV